MNWKQTNAAPMIDRLRARHPSHKDAAVGVTCALTGKGKAAYETPKNRSPEIVCYATTAAVDLADEVVIPGGVDLSYFMANRNLFVDHRYDAANVVGHCRSMTMTDEGWVCRGQLLGTDSPMERAVVAMAKAGTLAMSIAFVALDWGDPTPEERKAYPGASSIVRRSKALEVSYTALPMNVNCRMLAYYDESEAEKAYAAAKSAGIASAVMESFGLPRRTITRVFLS